MITLEYDFRSLFTCCPTSEEEEFHNIKRCVSIFEPEKILQLKPSPEASIQQLEKLVKQEFNQELPLPYKIYLQQMGGEDGGVLSRFLDYRLEEWNGFKKDNMAQGALEFIKKSKIPSYIREKSSTIPPFWYFYYGFLAEVGWGFSPTTKNPNQLVMTDGRNFYFTHDTFSKMLFFSTYIWGVRWVDEHSMALEYGEQNLPSELHDMFLVSLLADCPQNWDLPGHALLVDFLKELESRFSLEECWFSGNKEFDSFDAEGNVSGALDGFSRYVGFHTISDFTICVRYYSFYKPSIRVDAMGSDINFRREIVSAILQHVDLQKISLKKLITN